MTLDEFELSDKNVPNSPATQRTVRINSAATMNPTDRSLFQKIIVGLAKTMFKFGAPSYRIEERIEAIARRKKISIEIIVQPNSILISFGDQGTPQNVFFVRVHPAPDMGRLQDVDTLARLMADHDIEEHDVEDESGESRMEQGLLIRVSKHSSQFLTRVKSYLSRKWVSYLGLRFKPQVNHLDSLGLMDCEKALEEIDASTETTYALWIRAIANAVLCSIATLLIFRGTPEEALTTLILGGLNACLVWLAEKYTPNAVDVFVPFVIGILANLSILIDNSMCIGTLTLASIMTLYPGTIITLAMLEMASKNMAAGSIRIFFAFIRSLKLGFGLSLAARLVKFISGEAVHLTCQPAPTLPVYFFVLLIPFSAAACVQLKAHWHQWPVVSYFVKQISNMF